MMKNRNITLIYGWIAEISTMVTSDFRPEVKITAVSRTRNEKICNIILVYGQIAESFAY